MDNAFIDFRALYEDDPVGMARQVLGFDPDEAQAAVMRAVANGERRISIRSGHGTGKTSVLAVLTVWHAVTKYPQVVVATAPTSSQLFDALAAQTKSWFKKLPPPILDCFDIKSESISLKVAPDDSFVSFRTSRPEMPEALAGVHSENVLLIADEASGVPEQVFVAASGSMSGFNACTILGGNPVRTSGLFYDTHHDLANRWTTFHWTCVGHPRISNDFIEDMESRYGRDTNDWRVRVEGNFPRAEADTIIPYGVLQDALDRDVYPTMVQPIWGLDCARKGGDRSALAKRKGNVLMEHVKTWKDLELMELTGRVKTEWDNTMPSDRPHTICVDAIGMGAGVADRLAELGLPARSINVSESPPLGGNYLNLKTELWYKVRQFFLERSCSMRGDRQLVAELGWPHQEYTSSGKLKVESKDKIRKRHKGSHDVADAFVLTFATDAVSALMGSLGSSSWKEPLKREIRCLV